MPTTGVGNSSERHDSLHAALWHPASRTSIRVIVQQFLVDGFALLSERHECQTLVEIIARCDRLRLRHGVPDLQCKLYHRSSVLSPSTDLIQQWFRQGFRFE